VENTGWTITLWNQLDGPDRLHLGLNLGDGIGASFSRCQAYVLGTTQKQSAAHKKTRSKRNSVLTLIEES